MDNQQQISFTHDENTMWNALNNKLLKWRPRATMEDDRFWFIAFTKPYDFDHKENNEVWFMQIKVWDRQENRFIGTIKSRERYKVIMSQHIDIEHQRIVLRTKEYITIHSFTGETLKVYAFNTEADQQNKKWQCKFIDKDTFLTISTIGWSIIRIDKDEEHVYWKDKPMKIDERTTVVNLPETPYSVIVSAFPHEDMNPFKATAWEKYDGKQEPAIHRSAYLLKSLTFTPLDRIFHYQVAEVGLKGYILNPGMLKVSIEGEYLKINNTMLYIEDFKEIKE